MRVWMMNPESEKLPPTLPACVIISDEPDDMPRACSTVVRLPDRVVGLDSPLQEVVRSYKEHGYVEVVPVEEIRKPAFVLIQHWPDRGEEHRQAMEAVFQTAEKLGLEALDRWSARYTVVQLFDQEGSPIPPVLSEEAKAQLKDAHSHVWAVLSE